jgi:hypothetical protein
VGAQATLLYIIISYFVTNLNRIFSCDISFSVHDTLSTERIRSGIGLQLFSDNDILSTERIRSNIILQSVLPLSLVYSCIFCVLRYMEEYT